MTRNRIEQFLTRPPTPETKRRNCRALERRIAVQRQLIYGMEGSFRRERLPWLVGVATVAFVVGLAIGR